MSFTRQSYATQCTGLHFEILVCLSLYLILTGSQFFLFSVFISQTNQYDDKIQPQTYQEYKLHEIENVEVHVLPPSEVAANVRMTGSVLDHARRLNDKAKMKMVISGQRQYVQFRCGDLVVICSKHFVEQSTFLSNLYTSMPTRNHIHKIVSHQRAQHILYMCTSLHIYYMTHSSNKSNIFHLRR